MSKIYQKKTLYIKNSVERDFGGFTLIELLVVVLIIGILAAIALPQYEKAVISSRMAQSLGITKSIKDNLNIFYTETGRYPLPDEFADSVLNYPNTNCVFDGSYSARCRVGDFLIRYMQIPGRRNVQVIYAPGDFVTATITYKMWGTGLWFRQGVDTPQLACIIETRGDVKICESSYPTLLGTGGCCGSVVDGSWNFYSME